MEQMWAAKTTSNRRNLWRIFQNWARERKQPVTASTAVLIVMATGVAEALDLCKKLPSINGENGNRQLTTYIRARGGNTYRTSPHAILMRE